MHLKFVLLAAILTALASPVAARSITVDDIARQRHIDALDLSPDGSRFAILVHHGDPVANQIATEWLAGDLHTGRLVRIGDGGELPRRSRAKGEWAGTYARWSPDGQWIAYTRSADGETQLWRAKADGSHAGQLTHNAADVGDFAWEADGRSLLFRTGEPRAAHAALVAERDRSGYQFDEDIRAFTDFLVPRERPVSGQRHLWTVDAETGKEQRADHSDAARLDQKGEGEASYGAQAALAGPQDLLSRCAAMSAAKWLCVRSTQTRPDHVVEVDVRTRALRVVADPNPEFAGIHFGKVDRIEWQIPEVAAYRPGTPLAGLMNPTTHGFILYPPGFDPKKLYPMIVSPYYSDGFDDLTRVEMPLQALAAQGFVVLNLSFPHHDIAGIDRLSRDLVKATYDPAQDFPLLTLFAESTLKAIDLVAARGFVDPKRIGIGGLSQGTFVPLWAVQHHDRFSAMAISSMNWGPFQYYWQTGGARKQRRYESFLPKPDHDSEAFWKALDIAENVDQIETPILMNFGDEEVWAMLRLIRHMADAGKPYDAFVYRGEGHIKLDPAHLSSIMNRNLDWFRFWLQDREDPDPAKAAQYARWRELRKLQCRNPRSLRDYCNVESQMVPVAR